MEEISGDEKPAILKRINPEHDDHSRKFISEHGSSRGTRPAELRGQQLKYDNLFPTYCDVCKLNFRSERCYKIHFSLRHESVLPYSCRVCDKRYSYKRSLRKHLNGKHPGTIPKHGNRFTMKVNDEARTLKEKLESTCQELRKRDNSKGNVTSLNRWNYSSELPKCCDICDVRFKSYTQYQKHHTQQHPGVALVITCEHCDRGFRNHSSLRNHARNYHQDVENAKGLPPKFVRNMLFECEYWGDGISGISNYEKHGVEKHPEQYLFRCSHCAKGFKKMATMKEHLRTHVVTGYVCKFCGNRYFRKREVESHEEKCLEGAFWKRREDAKGRFCDVCQTILRIENKKTFLKHVATCAKYVKCDACELRFHKRNLRRLEHHVKIRHPYKGIAEGFLLRDSDAYPRVKEERNDVLIKEEKGGEFISETGFIVKEEICSKLEK